MIKKKPRLRRSTDLATWLRGGAEIAAVLGVDRKHLPELVEKHKLPAFKYLGRWTLIAADLPEWMRYIKDVCREKKRPRPTQRPHPSR